MSTALDALRDVLDNDSDDASPLGERAGGADRALDIVDKVAKSKGLLAAMGRMGDLVKGAQAKDATRMKDVVEFTTDMIERLQKVQRDAKKALAKAS